MRSGSTSREQVRGWELLIGAQLGLRCTWEGDEIRLLLCFTLYKIFSVRDAAVPLCFIYAKRISRQRDLCQAAFVGIDQRMSDFRNGY